MLSCLKLNLHPTRFRINELNGRRTGRRGITNGKARPMQHKKSDELIVAMMVKPMIHRTCAAGCRGRLYEEKTQPSEGVLALDRVKMNSTITLIR